jgi:Holliday junction resolvasome RuvABC DNA-binding subunit
MRLENNTSTSFDITGIVRQVVWGLMTLTEAVERLVDLGYTRQEIKGALQGAVSVVLSNQFDEEGL